MESKQRNCGNNRRPECEIFKGGIPEAAESERNWNLCTKNPGHNNFKSAKDFKENHLPKLQNAKSREWLRSRIDLTVRLRVHCTSKERPHDDGFAHVRGTALRRMGTGFINNVSPLESSRPFPCVQCGRKETKMHWGFDVLTAHHVVFNDEEARETKVDLFFDDESCDKDGKMKSVWAMKVVWCDTEGDWCNIVCVTCDAELGERILSAYYGYDDINQQKIQNLFGHDLLLSCSGKNDDSVDEDEEDDDEYEDLDLSGQDFLPSSDRDFHVALIVSHPHGQPKKITFGEWKGMEDPTRCNHTAPTCPGSSGARVFRVMYNTSTDRSNGNGFYIYATAVHSGSYDKTSTKNKDQLNYGNWK